MCLPIAKGTQEREILHRVEVNIHKQGRGGKDTIKQYQCWQCGEVGHLRRECPSLKDKGLSQRGSAGPVHRD